MDILTTHQRLLIKIAEKNAKPLKYIDKPEPKREGILSRFSRLFNFSLDKPYKI